MTGTLDLVITLTPPPDGAPPDQIARIGLSCPALGSSHEGAELRDPLTPSEHTELRWYLEQYWRWPFGEFAARGARAEGLLADAGHRLYEAVFGSIPADRILQAWRLLKPETPHQISIVSHVPAALTLPWELLHDAQGFLTLRSVSIVRRLPQAEQPPEAAAFTLPLRVLLVTARPDDAGFIDQRAIARELLDEVQAQVAEGQIEIELLRPPTLAGLQQRLRDKKRPVHILHFDGHGAFAGDVAGAGSHEQLLGGRAQGLLAFEDDDGRMELVAADTLANVLQAGGVRLAMLTACQSAVGSAEDALSSVAGRLIKGGVDAVVAMGASVLVVAAARYVEAFYRELARGTTAPAAHELARQALYVDPKRHVFQRERDKPGQPVTLQDWWLPHFYQQRPLQLQPASKRKPKPIVPPAFAGFPEGFPAVRGRGFYGRARELLTIERTLRRGKLVVIHGFGGMGKTALTHEAADWLTRTGMYRGACFVSFEHGGDAPTLLHALGIYLGIADAQYDHTNISAALDRLRPALRLRPTLIIADNLESIMPGGEAPLPADERAKLWDVLLALGGRTQGSPLHPCGVLLTTRTPTLGDGRLEPSQTAAHLPLRGLRPDDAYDLASALLDDMQIERARAPYPNLRDLLAQLDQHPLAIHLVLPALRDHPIQRIRDDFAALLPRFADDHATGRNRSLLASLDYSLRRLSEEQRALLARLAPFESGASEDDLLAITEIPEAEWSALRPALEQAALLTPERVAHWTAPFLRFHPVLAPYLRTQPGADDAALQQRYIQRYYALANYFYNEDHRNPQPVRALVWRELPNLRRAIVLLAMQGDAEALAEMATTITLFLDYFGLLRERDELQALVERAATSSDGALIRAEYLRESNAGEAEFASGNLRGAYARFSALLGRIEAQPAGAPLGSGSYEHCLTFMRLARCLRKGGQPAAAEDRLREALAVIDALIAQQPDNQGLIRQRGVLLTDLGDVLADQGKYSEGQAAYEEGLEIAKQGKDTRQQGVILGQLGTLALMQRDYAEARERYTAALALFKSLDEPASEAVAWHQLGRVAQEQREWATAEDAYRRSAEIEVRLGNPTGAAMTYNQLANVAKSAGHLAEAEGWYRRALEIDERFGNQKDVARDLNNLAALLWDEARTGNQAWLAEARKIAKRALTIRETLDASSEIWKTLSILADIAALEGRADAAREYRRRERETFAAFAGNRWHIDQQHGQLIADIVAAAQGDEQARAAMETRLPQLEAKGWRIADTTRRIWAGERDWHTMCEGIDRNSALLALRLLEALPASPPALHAPGEGERARREAQIIP